MIKAKDLAARLPKDLMPKTKSCDALLTAVTLLTNDRSNARMDTKRLNWLSNKDNQIGNVQLPTQCVKNNLHSLRGAIDDAMQLDAYASVLAVL